MKVQFTPVFSAASGKTGDIVAANWKGRAYIRRRVVPNNPNTVPQQDVRNSMARIVELFRTLDVKATAWLNTRGTLQRWSGANKFASLNRALEQSASLLVPLPPIVQVDAIADFAYDSEPVPGSLKADWTDPALAGYTKVFFATRQTDLNVFADVTETTLASAGTITFTGKTAGKTYQVYSALYNPTTFAFGTISSFSHLQVA